MYGLYVFNIDKIQSKIKSLFKNMEYLLFYKELRLFCSDIPCRSNIFYNSSLKVL